MPVEFLTQAQRERYGRYQGEPSSAQLSKYFYLSDGDRRAVLDRHGDSNRLGFALHLCTVRFLGTFCQDLSEVPPSAIFFVSSQLGIEGPLSLLKNYRVGRTRRDHQLIITEMYGYREYSDPFIRFQLTRTLYTRAWLSCDRPIVLFDGATEWLVSRKILLPGVTILERLVGEIRIRAEKKLWARISSQVDVGTRERLMKTLERKEGSRFTTLERLRRSPSRLTAKELIRALERVGDIKRLIELGPLFPKTDLSSLPQPRLRSLHRFVNGTPIQAISRIGERDPERCLAMLAAWAHFAYIRAGDDVLDMFDQLIGKVLSRAARTGKKERLRSIKELDRAARLLSDACSVLIDSAVGDSDVRTTAFTRVSKPDLIKALCSVGEITRPPDDEYLEHLKGSYNHIRQFLPLLLSPFEFGSTEAGRSIVKALDYLRGLEGSKKQLLSDAPREVISKQWRPFAITGDDFVQRRYYTD